MGSFSRVLSASSSSRGFPARATTPFVGRAAELEELRGLLREPDRRLVSLVGPGGAGKTRLALELAASLGSDFPDGKVFLSLANLRGVEDFLPALQEALGLQLPLGGDLERAIRNHLRPRQILLVLDNFESALDLALILDELLAAAPQVKALATSREKLDLLGETVYHLGGLHLPDLEDSEKAYEADALKLFLQRARQARPGYQLGEDGPSVLALCRLVDGLPLGILLAAAWMDTFPAREILDQASQDLDFLAQELRDLPPRHRSMRAVFDSSFRRLDERLQIIFRRLAVFQGGFDLPAAESVAGADLKALLAFAHKSLLWRDLSTGRYELHELLRQYARELLTRSGEFEQIQAGHKRYYLQFLGRREEYLKGEEQIVILDEIQADFDNIQAAWSQAVADGDSGAIRKAALALYAFCDMRCRIYEGEALFREAAWAEAKPPTTSGLVLLSWYDLRAYDERVRNLDEITSLAQICLVQAEAAGDPQETAAGLVLLGALDERRGEFEAAIQYYERSLQICPALDDFYWTNLRIGLCCQSMGQHQAAVDSFQTSLERGQRTGERVKIGWSLFNLGDTQILQGALQEAEASLQQAFGLFQETGTLVGVLQVSLSLGKLALVRGDLDKAQELAYQAVELARSTHSAAWMEKAEALLAQTATCPSLPKTQPLVEPLSERELEVLRWLKSELSGPEIARTLNISLNTVRYHTKNIYSKLQVGNRREAVRLAEELGL